MNSDERIAGRVERVGYDGHPIWLSFTAKVSHCHRIEVCISLRWLINESLLCSSKTWNFSLLKILNSWDAFENCSEEFHLLDTTILCLIAISMWKDQSSMSRPEFGVRFDFLLRIFDVVEYSFPERLSTKWTPGCSRGDGGRSMGMSAICVDSFDNNIYFVIVPPTLFYLRPRNTVKELNISFERDGILFDE